jgi:flagellar export protein FliJ
MSQRPRFAALVVLHERQEQEARRRLGELERKRQDITERIGMLLGERHSAAVVVGLSGRDQLTRYWIHIEAQVRGLHEALAKSETEISAARTVLAEAHRAHATFIKLQEIDALERARLAERQAQRRMEEFAVRRFNERQAEETRVAVFRVADYRVDHQEDQP